MNSFLDSVCALLEQGEDVVIVTIAMQSGSTPRESGAKMAVRRDGSILGTVGGGLMEAGCIELGREMLTGRFASSAAESGPELAVIRHFDLSNEEAAKAAMVCGGRLTVVAEHIQAGRRGAEVLCAARDSLLQGRPCGLETTMERLEHTAAATREACFAVTGRKTPDCGHAAPAAASATLDCDGKTCRFTEWLQPSPRMIIFGAGHVALPTAAMASMTGFAVTVLDDREEFASPQRFPQARTVVLPDFGQAFAQLTITPQCYVVIMTRGHLHDKTVLEQALKTPACYVGMIGSRRKRDALYDQLRSEGVDESSIARCHCPIGLKIGARTPEEIAVSIMAEIIACRAAGNGNGAS